MLSVHSVVGVESQCELCVFQLETLAVADFDVERGRDIPLWIIIVAVVVGFLLLALVIILLWKVRTAAQPLRSRRRFTCVRQMSPLV